MSEQTPEPIDETVTTRDRIRQVIEEWWSDWSSQAGPPEVLRSDLAERIDRALFELAEDEEQALEQWAADELAGRERTRSELAALKREIGKLPIALTTSGAYLVGAAWAAALPVGSVPNVVRIWKEHVTRLAAAINDGQQAEERG